MLHMLGMSIAFFREPAVANPPRRLSRDWWLVGVLVVLVAVEYIFNTELVWRPIPNLLVLAVIPLLLYRRTHPLLTLATVFIVINVGLGLITFFESYPQGPYVAAFLLIHVYALFRWGSGRDCLIGLGFMFAAYLVGIVLDYNGIGEAIGGAIVLLFPAELGSIVRLQHDATERRADEIRSAEREQIARELHDSVAHHVSAIAIQAQAGRTVAASNPDAAVESLVVIEEAAARTLSDMRSIVGSLRGDGGADLAPQPGVRDLPSLAGRVNGIAISVDATDVGAGTSAAVGTALFRMAQESVTNAVRHAKGASHVDVRLAQHGDSVQLTVHDDGRSESREASTAGYGLIGMAERARLLGGSFSAGPEAEGGWVVRADLPAAETSI